MMVIDCQPQVVRLLGNYHEGNFGDDALLVACAALLKKDLRQVAVDGDIAYCDLRVDCLRSRSSATQPQLIVYGGGTQFFSFESTTELNASVPLVHRLARKILSPASALASVRARIHGVKLQRIPKVAIGIGIGPFNNKLAADQAAQLLRKMDLIWVRDAHSEAFCRTREIPNVVASADLCFTQAFTRATVPFSKVNFGEFSHRKICIVLRDWKNLDDGFFGRQVRLAYELRAMGHVVSFIGLSPHDDRYLSEMAALGEDVRVWNAKAERLEGFWALLSQQDLIVTSRFHGAIFALLSQTPFVAIEIEPKLTNLRDMVPELAPFAIDPTATADQMCKTIKDILEQRDSLLPALAYALAVQKARASAGQTALESYLATGRL